MCSGLTPLTVRFADLTPAGTLCVRFVDLTPETRRPPGDGGYFALKVQTVCEL